MLFRFVHPFGAQVSAVVGALALAACVACVFLGGFGWELKRAERQFRARHLEGRTTKGPPKSKTKDQDQRTGIIIGKDHQRTGIIIGRKQKTKGQA